ncbi:SMI1/KNR4 family protein [Kitasatospora sp. NPDC006786]|uniref:SMI1/KNR4 family protein n=1 Tax=unclassified Kitasatospora TaxID=2633591 RepID=UPI0033C0CA60
MTTSPLRHTDVPTSWSRIGTWLTAHTRRDSARPAPDASRLDAFEKDLGLPLPADLRAWWLLPDVTASHWIPGEFAPVPLDEALETHDIWLLVAEQEGDSFDENGQPEARYQREFMPIALSPGGDGLIVDLRPGDTHGAVLLWDHETWDLDVPRWASVTSMLQDIANALETGTPALLDHADLAGSAQPCTATIDGALDLTWQPAWSGDRRGAAGGVGAVGGGRAAGLTATGAGAPSLAGHRPPPHRETAAVRGTQRPWGAGPVPFPGRGGTGPAGAVRGW